MRGILFPNICARCFVVGCFNSELTAIPRPDKLNRAERRQDRRRSSFSFHAAEMIFFSEASEDKLKHNKYLVLRLVSQLVSFSNASILQRKKS